MEISQPVKIQHVSISNFLGHGPSPRTIDLGENSNLLLVGRNNSGKTSVFSALKLFKSVVREGSFETGHGSGGGENFVQYGWANCGFATADIFHKSLGQAYLEVTFLVDYKKFGLEKLLRSFGIATHPNHVPFKFRIDFQEKKKKLALIEIHGVKIFTAGASTNWFRYSPDDRFQFVDTSPQALTALLRMVVDGIAHFPSTRHIRTGGNVDLDDDLTSGLSLIPWLQAVKNPDATNGRSKRFHRLLNEFYKKFGEFIGEPDLELSVSNSQTLQITIAGELIPIENLGHGIAECLVIMLSTTIAKAMNAEVHSILLDEPELHLHPHMQRMLVRELLGSDHSLFVSTHSPTVISEMVSGGSTIYAVQMSRSSREIELKQLKCDDEIRAALADIGASAADVLLAERVLWVEGPTDVPIFREWVMKCPTYKEGAIAILPLGGDIGSNPHYDFSQLKSLNPRTIVILDSERESNGGNPADAKMKVLEKCKTAGIFLHLTDRRCTENYLSVEALRTSYKGHAVPDSIDGYKKITEQVKVYSKNRGHLVARQMTWEQIAKTDIGQQLASFLTS